MHVEQEHNFQHLKNTDLSVTPSCDIKTLNYEKMFTLKRTFATGYHTKGIPVDMIFTV